MRQRLSRTRRTHGFPKAPVERQRTRGRDSGLSTAIPGARIPPRLLEAIEAERDNLSKAESLLACMVVSMEYQNDPLEGPYYPAVAQLARELIGRSIDGLDPFMLRQRLLRNKIEEVFCVSFIEGHVMSPQASAA
jgi:hypothetical protein